MAVPSQCPLCGEKPENQNVVTPHVYGGKKGQAFFRCSTCDVSYLFPGLSPEEERQFYAAEFSSFMTSRAGADAGWQEPDRHVKANESTVARRMKYLRPRLPRMGRILEVGCSSGFMLYPLQEEGYECVGVEPSGVFADYVRSKGIVCFDSFDEVRTHRDYGEGFDVIMHYFVLEHVSNPHAFLKGQVALLKEQGRLIFEIPNSADALLTIYAVPEFERFYWMVAHHWYLSERSLGYLLGQTGLHYEILLDQRYDLSNHMVWARDGRPGGMGRFTDKLGVDIEKQYREALIRSRHCDTLIGVLKKHSR